VIMWVRVTVRVRVLLRCCSCAHSPCIHLRNMQTPCRKRVDLYIFHITSHHTRASRCPSQFRTYGKLMVFVQPGAKVDSSYYCDVVLNQGLLPNIQKLS